jgi:hypothetical protein
MKRFTAILLALLLAGAAWGATTYFGYCSSDGTPTGTYANRQYWSGAEIDWREANSVGDTCPGSDAQAILDIGIQTSATGYNVRMGVYTEAGALVVQTTEKASVNDAWVSWTSAELTWEAGYTSLTGGSAYHIAFAADAAGSANGGVNGAIFCQRFVAGTDYTGGMPTSLAAGTQGQEYFNVRVGVDAAAGGSAIPQLMYYYRSQQ